MRSVAKVRRNARVFLVDDHPLIRQALKDTFRREHDLSVCGEAEDCRHALEAIAATKPDLAIVDLKLRDSDGLALVKDISSKHPRTLTLVLSMHDESLHAERAIRAGACGYISKLEGTTKIVEAVRRILGGEIYWTEKAAAEVASKSVCPGRVTGAASTPAELLSERELQVFELIGAGNSTSEISDSLHIDTSTVETYRARIKEKLSLRDADQLRHTAIRWNLTMAAL